MACNCTCEPDLNPSMRWGDLLGQKFSIQVKGDLGPTAPVSISYCLFFVNTSGSRFQVGPPTRFPVADKSRLGVYYPVGRMDQQPGAWVIRWAVQMNFWEPVQYVEQSIQVLDAVAANVPGDHTERVAKQDWS